MSLKGNALKNYLRAIKLQSRRHNGIKKYIDKYDGNMIRVDYSKLYHESLRETSQLGQSVRATGYEHTPGDLIDMCKLCSDKGYHVPYTSTDGEELTDDQLKELICDQIVTESLQLYYDEAEELLEDSNIPVVDIQYVSPEILEYEERIDKQIKTVRRLFMAAALVCVGFVGVIVYSLV